MEGHNRHLSFLGGVPLSIRIDNLKTGVKKGAGAWAVLNDSYLAYAEQVGFVIDPARVRKASDKGKVERRVQDVLGAIIRRGERFVTLEDLNAAAAERVLARAKRLINPVTGGSVHDAWLAEREVLRPLPEHLPIPFDVQVGRNVTRDCLVRFEGREYAVPFRYAGRQVQVRGAPGLVQIFADGEMVQSYPRHTAARLLIDQACYEGEATERVAAPTPLGRLGQQIVAPRSWEAAQRPVSAYETLLRRITK